MSMVWKQIGPMPKPVDKLYYDSTNGIPQYQSSYINNSSWHFPGFAQEVIVINNNKIFSVECNGVKKTVYTLNKADYHCVFQMIKISDRDFLLIYRCQTNENADGIPSYTATAVRRFIITDSSLTMSSALTIGASETPTTGGGFNGTFISDSNWNSCEFSGVKFNFKESVKYGNYYSYPSTQVYNGFYLNGVSSLALWSTSWTTLYKTDDFDSDGFCMDKYGCHYYRYAATVSSNGTYTENGMTNGYCHRINGRNGNVKNMVLENANGATSTGALGDNIDFAGISRSLIYGRLNNGDIIASGTDNSTNYSTIYIYSFDSNSNIFYKCQTLSLPELKNALVESKNIGDFRSYYCGNNIWVAGCEKIGMFIYQILGGRNLNYPEYQALYLGKVDAEKAGEALQIETQGIFASRGLYGTLGDQLIY